MISSIFYILLYGDYSLYVVYTLNFWYFLASDFPVDITLQSGYALFLPAIILFYLQVASVSFYCCFYRCFYCRELAKNPGRFPMALTRCVVVLHTSHHVTDVAPASWRVPKGKPQNLTCREETSHTVHHSPAAFAILLQRRFPGAH